MNRSEVLKIEKRQKQMRCFDFHKIFQDVLLIVLNVLPLFETYSEKNQKQTRCFDFHKIFQQERRTTEHTRACQLGFIAFLKVVRKKPRSEFFSIKSRERERVESRRSDLPLILFLYSFD